jgi:hypothetical protein
MRSTMASGGRVWALAALALVNGCEGPSAGGDEPAHTEQETVDSSIPEPKTATVEKGANKTESALEMSAGTMISRVIAGTDFSGRTLVVSGYALNRTDGGLVNVGRSQDLSSARVLNFVSVYDVPKTIPAGSKVRFRVHVETSRAIKLPGGETAVLIETAFRAMLK